MKKKILSLVLLVILFWNPFSFTFAKSKVIYERSENLAKQYIENSLNDDNWINKNPYISWEWKKFYTDDEKNPSYIEFKISCDNQKDCWFILVNSDWNDVAVPIASTSWIWPWELLSLQNESKINKKNKDNKTNKKSNNKLYYFWPLEQYSIDEENEEFISINPQDDIEQILESDKTLKKEDKEKEIKNKKRELKTRVDGYKIKAKEYKKSDDFKKHKEEIKDEILKMPKEEFVFEKLDMAFADLPEWTNWTYVSPWTSDIKIPWNSTSDCTSRTPCYKQFQTTYGSTTCSSWCAPTAVAILFWYYDRNWFSDLVIWTAPTSQTMDSVSKWLVNSVAGKIWTYCDSWEWKTSVSNIINAKQYAIDKGYKNTTSSFISWTISTLFSNIKTEINSWRPVISNIIYQKDWKQRGHTTVIYWYKSSPTNSNIVLMNMWWWTLPVDWLNTYTYSSINQNLSSVYYFWSNNKPVTSIVKFTIKQ